MLFGGNNVNFCPQNRGDRTQGVPCTSQSRETRSPVTPPMDIRYAHAARHDSDELVESCRKFHHDLTRTSVLVMCNPSNFNRCCENRIIIRIVGAHQRRQSLILCRLSMSNCWHFVHNFAKSPTPIKTLYKLRYTWSVVSRESVIPKTKNSIFVDLYISRCSLLSRRRWLCRNGDCVFFRNRVATKCTPLYHIWTNRRPIESY